MSEEARTAFTLAAVDLASLFNTSFGAEDIAGYRVHLSEPEGPSTGGGVQVRQNITLEHPTQKKVLLAGSCNKLGKTAELRSFKHMAAIHRERYDGQEVAIDPIQYGDLIKRLHEFFGTQGFNVTEAKEKAANAEPAPKPKVSKSAVGMIVFLVFLVLAMAGGFVWFFKFYEG